MYNIKLQLNNCVFSFKINDYRNNLDIVKYINCLTHINLQKTMLIITTYFNQMKFIMLINVLFYFEKKNIHL